MPDYQRTVDELRAALYSYTPAVVDHLRELVVGYDEACREVNARLQKCGDLLRQGLRSEAIQLAEIQPRLLDLVAALDFPEREQMTTFLGRCGIVPPLPLQMDVAAQLNEAYAIEEPLRTLLDRHRLLALSRAALPERIDVLRQIAKTDDDNVVWQEDLQLYEQERFKQIQAEVAVASQHGDVTALAELEDELQDDAWIERPSSALVRRASEARARHVRVLARDELDQLERDLNSAFGAYDVAAGRSLRERWKDACARAEVGPEDAVVVRAAPALEWLAEQDRHDYAEAEFTAAVAALEAALDSDASPIELERLYHAAARWGTEIPPTIERRLHGRIQSAELNRSRRMRLITGIAVTSILVVAAGVGWTIWQLTLSAEIRARSESLADLIEDEKYGAASDYLTELEDSSPRVAASDEIQSLQVRLAELMGAEEERAALFRQAVANIGSPEQADGSAVAQARRLAKTVAEKAKIAEIESAIGRAATAARRVHDERFADQLRGLAEQVAAFEQRLPEDLAVRGEQIKRWQKEIQAIESGSGAVSPALRAQISVLLSRMSALESERLVQLKERESLAAVVESVGNREAFLKRLSEYAEQFPQSARATDFRRVIDEAPLWEAIEHWEPLVLHIASRKLEAFDPETAAKAVAQIDAALGKYTNYPDVEAFRVRLPFLQAVAKRSKDGERIEKSLISLFNNTLVADLWMVETEEGRFYTKQEPNLRGSLPSFKYLSNLDNTEKNRAVKPGELKFQGPAPQQALGKAVRERLSKLTDETWDRDFYRVIFDIIADKQTDALLRLQLLERTLEVACEGSHILERAFKPFRLEIENAKVNLFSNWLDPNDIEAKRNRAKAEELLLRLAKNAEPAQQISQVRQAVPFPFQRGYEWAGVLVKDPLGRWIVGAARKPFAAGKLFVVVPGRSGQPAVAHEIGAVNDGRFALLDISASLGIQGRPVFVAD